MVERYCTPSLSHLRVSSHPAPRELNEKACEFLKFYNIQKYYGIREIRMLSHLIREELDEKKLSNG